MGDVRKLRLELHRRDHFTGHFKCVGLINPIFPKQNTPTIFTPACSHPSPMRESLESKRYFVDYKIQCVNASNGIKKNHADKNIKQNTCINTISCRGLRLVCSDESLCSPNLLISSSSS